MLLSFEERSAVLEVDGMIVTDEVAGGMAAVEVVDIEDDEVVAGEIVEVEGVDEIDEVVVEAPGRSSNPLASEFQVAITDVGYGKTSKRPSPELQQSSMPPLQQYDIWSFVTLLQGIKSSPPNLKPM